MINSMLLTFGPIVATYSGFNLGEHKAYGAFLIGALAFVLTQMAKFTAMAIFVPVLFPADSISAGDDSGTEFIMEQEILKAVVGLFDLVGLYFLLSAKKLISVSELRIKLLAVGLGWAAADLAIHNFMYVVLQMWANEIKSEFLVTAFQANFDLLEIIVLVRLAWTLTKKEVQVTQSLAIYGIVLVRYLFPIALRFVQEGTLFESAALSQVAAKAAFAGSFYLISKGIAGDA